ncbi:hypothetical protein [Roseivirga sp.]|uniref:hypothetical protein n=1 Tax=Roseivirga sp. TaxID=1964215 RepID=UPI003B516E36
MLDDRTYTTNLNHLFKSFSKATLWVISIIIIASFQAAGILIITKYVREGDFDFNLVYENGILLFFSYGVLCSAIVNRIINSKEINRYWLLVLVLILLIVSLIAHTVFIEIYFSDLENDQFMNAKKLQNHVLWFTLAFVWIDKIYYYHAIDNSNKETVQTT